LTRLTKAVRSGVEVWFRLAFQVSFNVKTRLILKSSLVADPKTKFTTGACDDDGWICDCDGDAWIDAEMVADREDPSWIELEGWMVDEESALAYATSSKQKIHVLAILLFLTCFCDIVLNIISVR